MPYPKIDASRLRVFPLAARRSFIGIEAQRADPAAPPPVLPAAAQRQIEHAAGRIHQARKQNASVMLAYGAHLVKNGGAPLINELLRGGHVTHLATQGAGTIHDWEFAFQGSSSESVRENAAAGTFGSWDETGRFWNLAVLAGAAEGLGLGEALGRFVAEDGLTVPEAAQLRALIAQNPSDELTGARADLLWTIERFQVPAGRMHVPHPFKQHSILGTAHRAGVPLTVHPGIGYDIVINHPFYHGGAVGRAAATDARVFVHSVDRLGVYLSVGSAIMSPQVFEKAFSAANNLRVQQKRPAISGHYIAVVDLQDGGGWDWSSGEPPKENPAYYLRFCKSFYRMGGDLDYVQCDNIAFLAGLLAQLR